MKSRLHVAVGCITADLGTPLGATADSLTLHVNGGAVQPFLLRTNDALNRDNLENTSLMPDSVTPAAIIPIPRRTSA